MPSGVCESRKLSCPARLYGRAGRNLIGRLIAITSRLRLLFESWSQPLVAERSEQSYHRTWPGRIGGAHNCWRAVPFNNIAGRVDGSVDPSLPRTILVHWRQLEFKRFPVGVQNQVEEHVLV